MEAEKSTRGAYRSIGSMLTQDRETERLVGVAEMLIELALTRIVGTQHAGPRDVHRGRHVKRERCGGSVRRPAKQTHCAGSKPPMAA